MATNKPPAARIPYFNGWVVWVIIVLVPVTWYAAHNIGHDPGDLPVSNWWWFLIWAGAFAARWAQVILIRRRVEPVWNYPTVRPWSDPLQTVDHEHLDMVTWFAASAGHTIAHAQEQLQDAAMFHYVEDGYEKYLRKYREAYGL